MKTLHQIYFGNSNDMSQITSESVDLMVTSPPYPMIEMWDDMFGDQNPLIQSALSDQDGSLAFELMNQELDKVWNEIYRVLNSGSIACINIGDATRKIGKDFQLYSNHSRILHHCREIGFQVLPCILWRKPTNAPNKFMGSGMLPPGAYVTLEHEYILILRKGGIKLFKSEEEKVNRRKSAFFWEERNLWFSDMWSDLKGAGQKLKGNNSDIRERSAAFPFELVNRLINMFSVQGDYVLDPYFGTGTTMVAAMVCGRNSIGFEIERNFKDIIIDKIKQVPKISKDQINQRIVDHLNFVKTRTEENKEFKYLNELYKFPVLTKQEKELFFPEFNTFRKVNDTSFEITYSDKPSNKYNFKIKDNYDIKEGLDHFIT